MPEKTAPVYPTSLRDRPGNKRHLRGSAKRTPWAAPAIDSMPPPPSHRPIRSIHATGFSDFCFAMPLRKQLLFHFRGSSLKYRLFLQSKTATKVAKKSGKHLA